MLNANKKEPILPFVAGAIFHACFVKALDFVPSNSPEELHARLEKLKWMTIARVGRSKTPPKGPDGRAADEASKPAFRNNILLAPPPAEAKAAGVHEPEIVSPHPTMPLPKRKRPTPTTTTSAVDSPQRPGKWTRT